MRWRNTVRPDPKPTVDELNEARRVHHMRPANLAKRLGVSLATAGIIKRGLTLYFDLMVGI